MAVMVDSMKTKGRKKAFMWLRRPSEDDVLVVVDDEGVNKKRKRKEGYASATDMVVAGVGGGGGGGGKESNSSSFPEGSKKERSRKSLSRVLKAVLFETSFNKKIGNKKSKEKSLQNSSSENGKVLNAIKGKASSQELPETQEDTTRISNSSGSSSCLTDHSTPLSSSSSTSSIASSSRSASGRKKTCAVDSNNNNKQLAEGGVCYFSSNMGLCYLLAVVLALLIWGKIFVIFCTSLCLFFASRRAKVIHPRSNDVVDCIMMDVDSEEYKKRVIMEGLLERNNRVHPATVVATSNVCLGQT